MHSARVLEAIKEHKPVAVLDSSLMTSTRGAFLADGGSAGAGGHRCAAHHRRGCDRRSVCQPEGEYAICQRPEGAGGGAGCDCQRKKEMNPSGSLFCLKV